jgi:hypothetical protein
MQQIHKLSKAARFSVNKLDAEMRKKMTTDNNPYSELTRHREEMKNLWLSLAISEETPSSLQFAVWLGDYGFDSLQAALVITQRWVNKQGDPSSVSLQRLVKYTSKVMSNARIDGMSEEESQQKLSTMRSLVGKVGARVRWQNAKKQVCHDLLSACHALPSVCHDLPAFATRDIDTDTDTDSDSVKDSEAPKNSETDKGTASESSSFSSSENITPKPEDFTSRLEYGAACRKAGVLPVPRKKRNAVLQRNEYQHEKATANVEEDGEAIRRAHGAEQCSDGIWRSEQVRIALGFSVKTKSGIWEKKQ